MSHSPQKLTGMAFHAVIAFNQASANTWALAEKASNFDPDLYKRILAAGPLYVAAHGESPLVYDGVKAMYIWADPKSPNPNTMLQIEGEIDGSKVTIDSLVLCHGAKFKGALVYQKPCCPAPSLVLLGFGEDPIVIDNIVDTKLGARNFWEDRAFEAGDAEHASMMHGLQDAMGFCGSHAHNKREHFKPHI